MVVVDVPQSIERRIHAPFIPYRRMVLLGSDRGFNANNLIYLLTETGVYVPYPLVYVDATCTIGQNVSILVVIYKFGGYKEKTVKEVDTSRMGH